MGKAEANGGTGDGNDASKKKHGKGRRFQQRVGNAPQQPKFDEQCEDLKGHIFYRSGYVQADIFVKTVDQLTNYVGRTCDGLISKAVEELTVPTIDTPPAPTDYGTDKCTPKDKFMWELQINDSMRK